MLFLSLRHWVVPSDAVQRSWQHVGRTHAAFVLEYGSALLAGNAVVLREGAVWPVRSYSFADPTLVHAFSLRGVALPLLGLVSAAMIMAAVVFWTWRKARRELGEEETLGVGTALVAGTLLTVLPLLLTLNLNALNPGDFLHGRYTYLPLAGLMLLVQLCAAWPGGRDPSCCAQEEP